jgi:hypothetical protein
MARADFKSPTGETPNKGKAKRLDPTMVPYYHELIAALISRGYKLNLGLEKSEILRTGLVALWKMDDSEFKEGIEALRQAEGRSIESKEAK